jgi:hypothetical protein
MRRAAQLRAELEAAQESARGGGKAEVLIGLPGSAFPPASTLGQWRPCALCSGGEGEIRTHETREGLPVFKTGAFNRSATSPSKPRNAVSFYRSSRIGRRLDRDFREPSGDQHR